MKKGIFITGSTGYIGSYVCEFILRNSTENLLVLVRSSNQEEARKKLWKAWQLHMDFLEFSNFIETRVSILLGDIAEKKLSLEDSVYRKLVDHTESILHIAASLNRKSSKVCFNVNMRGTLHVIQLGQVVSKTNGLKKFSDVSTVAVAGVRQDEVALENQMIDWARSDYDPYARTKKFCEYMIEEMLPQTPTTVFRPSIVLGDSRFSGTTQFDMVKAFVTLSNLPILPFDPDWRLDIVPANFVGHAIAKIHLKETSLFRSYNLSSGTESLTFSKIVESLEKNENRLLSRKFVPFLNTPTGGLVDAMAMLPRSWNVTRVFSLLKVFWPYLTFNTVFDNTRVQQELGEQPVSFSEYASDLKQFAVENDFAYPFKPLPADVVKSKKEVA